MHLIELFVVGAVRALDMGIEFGRLRGEHEQGQLFLVAGELEFGGELASVTNHSERAHPRMKHFAALIAAENPG